MPRLVRSCELIGALFGYLYTGRSKRYFDKKESVAQSVEQRTFNPWVESSSLSALTKSKPWFFRQPRKKPGFFHPHKAQFWPHHDSGHAIWLHRFGGWHRFGLAHNLKVPGADLADLEGPIFMLWISAIGGNLGQMRAT